MGADVCAIFPVETPAVVVWKLNVDNVLEVG
jgi:hypothetical protein